MRESVKEKIGESTYIIHPLPCSKGLKVLARLAKLLGPSIGLLIKKDQMEVYDAIAASIYELSATIKEEDLEWICEVFGEYTDVEDGRQTLKLDTSTRDRVFSANYGELFKWLYKSMEVNYGDFLDLITSEKGRPGAGGQSPPTPGRATEYRSG